MRSLSVTLLAVVTLLGYTTIALVIQTEEDLYQNTFPGLGSPCGGEDVCTQASNCLNGNSSEKRSIDISNNKDNPCGHYLVVCCSPDNVVEDPDSSDAVSAGDGNGITVPSVLTHTVLPVTPSPVKPPTTGCGLRHPEAIGPRIVGGTDNETEYGEFPWMMAILKLEDVVGQPNMTVYRCGGSLIHYQVVLTAAHCLHRIERSQLIVRAGEWDTQTTLERYSYQDRSVTEIVIHPKYYKGGQQNDVALLFLNSPFEPKTIIQPVCLPPQDTKFDYQTCFATGWGKDRYGKAGTYQAILRKIDLPIVPNVECEKSLRRTELGQEFTLDKSFICAGGEEGKDTCKGDGGSPLVCPIPNKLQLYYQTGVVSWGMGCGEKGIPGVYANVAKFRNWIDQHMIERKYGTSSYNP